MSSNTGFEINKRNWPLVGGFAILLFSAYMMGLMATSEEYGFVPVVLILGVSGVFLILKYPSVGYALMFFLAPLGAVTAVIGGGRTITFALGVFLLGIYGSRVLILHEKIKLDRVSMLALAFVGWGLITCLWAYDPRPSFQYILRLIQMIAVYVLILNYCCNQRRLNILTLGFVTGAVVSATTAIFMGTYVSNRERLSLSEDFNPNLFSALLGVGLILITNCFYKIKDKLVRAFFILSFIPIVFSIIQAQSRGVWIMLPASLLISMILTTRNLKLIKKVVVIFAVLIGIVITAYYAGIINEKVVERYRTLVSGDTSRATAGRTDIWKVGLEMVKDNLALGVGFRNYKVAFEHYSPKAQVYMDSKDAHNSFLSVLAETGIVGFTLFMGILVYLFKRIWHIKNSITRFTQIWLFFFLILISLKGTYHFYPWFWFVLALLALASSLEGQGDRKLSQDSILL